MSKDAAFIVPGKEGGLLKCIESKMDSYGAGVNGSALGIMAMLAFGQSPKRPRSASCRG